MASTEAFTVPPGLEKFTFTGVAEVGGLPEWLPQPTGPAINTVNVFVFDKVNQKILLPWSKEGFGVGRLLPFVAPLKPGDDPFEVAKEAVKTQTGGGVEASDFHDAGAFYVIIDGAESPIFAKAVAAYSYKGEPIETPGFKAEWFRSPNPTEGSSSLPPLPQDKMFEDEKYWYTHFFQGRATTGRVDFAAPAKPEDVVGGLQKHWFGFV